MSFKEPVGFKSSARVRASLDCIINHPFHLHEDVVELICLLDGSLVVSDSAQDYHLLPGDIYIFNPCDPHSIRRKACDSDVLTIQIDQKHYIEHYDFEDFPYFICGPSMEEAKFSADMRHLRFLMAKLFTEYNKAALSDLALEDLTVQLLNYLIEHNIYYHFYKMESCQVRMGRKIGDGNHMQSVARIYRILDYIYENYDRKLALRDIANREFLSEGYLSKYIKDASGLTFSEHLSLARCEQVERLLGETDKTMEQLAVEVGFANRNHLTRQFKKWFKKTPAEYKKSIAPDTAKTGMLEYKDADLIKAKPIIDRYLDGKTT